MTSRSCTGTSRRSRAATVRRGYPREGRHSSGSSLDATLVDVSFLEDLEFREVVGPLFDHPYERPEWHWDPEADYWSPSYSRQVRFPPRPARRPRFTGSATPPPPARPCARHRRPIPGVGLDRLARVGEVREARAKRAGAVRGPGLQTTKPRRGGALRVAHTGFEPVLPP